MAGACGFVTRRDRQAPYLVPEELVPEEGVEPMADASRLTRILVLTTTLPTEEGDATPSFVLDLAQAMAEQIPAEITIVAPASPGAPLRQQFGSVAVRRFRYLPSRWASLGADTAIMPAIRQRPSQMLQVPFLLTGLLLRGVQEARRARPDILHAHWIVPVGVVAVVARLLARRPVPLLVVTSHGSDVHSLRGPAWDRVRRFVVRRADLTLPVSPAIAGRLGVPAANVVPMAASPAFATVSRNAPADAPFLFVGRLADNKGVDVILEALARTPDASLRIVGDGPERDQLETLASSLGVSERCVFLGPLGKKEVAREMSSARALILASRTGADGAEEGSPTVLMEAVVAGLPIIASRIGAVPDLFRHGIDALLFDQGDTQTLAAHMRQVEQDAGYAEALSRVAAEHLGGSASFVGVARRYMAAIGDRP